MNTRKFIKALFIGSSLLAMHASVWSAAPSVSLDEARSALEKSSLVVVDIRETSEHATGVAKGALLVPMSQLGKRLGELPAAKSKPFLVICNTQNRSSRVVEQLQSMGYSNASYVNGGMSQWAARGWPMVKP
jgi:rhodanese-related sulfurtransferase